MKQYKSIDQYISSSPKEVRGILREVRKTIQKAAPEATEKISYGMPTFYLNGNLVHFAAFKNHIGLYPMPKAIVVFKKELAKYKTSKGAIQFPIDNVLLTLVSKIVKFRVRENQKK
ncbi:MAG: iron chaperone [Acidobacteriaceae bacterium]